jgi:hypothetical protein
MKIRFYFDEDAMDTDLIHALRIRGVDVTSALEQGRIRRPDSEHLVRVGFGGGAATRRLVTHHQEGERERQSNQRRGLGA